MSQYAVEIYGEVPVLVAGAEVQTVVQGRETVAENIHIVLVDDSVTVQVLVLEVARFGSVRLVVDFLFFPIFSCCKGGCFVHCFDFCVGLENAFYTEAVE